MKLTRFLGSLLAGMLLAATTPAGAAVFTSFSGVIAPSNWTAFNNDPNPGSYSFSSDGSSLDLSASAGAGPSDIILSATLSQSVTIYVSWALNNNGSSGGAPVAYYYENGVATQFTVGDPITITANTSIGFELSSSGTTPGKDPATLVIDFAPVPEPGVWSAVGGMILGCIYLVFAVIKQVRLRRQTA